MTNGNYSSLAAGTFNRISVAVNIIPGALSGLFRVDDAGTLVYFSQGNLKYDHDDGWLFHDNQYDYLTYTPSQWAAVENQGAVFLPCAGRRNGTTIEYDNTEGYYWTSDEDYQVIVSPNALIFYVYDQNLEKKVGRSVRLIGNN